MKIFNLILAVIFFIFAYLQLNDTPGDVLFWFLIYSLVGVVSAFGAFNKYNMWIIMIGVAGALYRLFRDVPAFMQWINIGAPSIVQEMKATTPYIETAREFFGLILVVIVLVYHYIRYTRIRNKRMAAESQKGI
ncbi:MAG TPA: transmembrane 220 family protein [Saprospiraceae bacterium]|nr:transmembrane 220 family protein [Saprospiraceae bacterium]